MPLPIPHNFTVGSEDLLYKLPAELRNAIYGELFFAESETVDVDRKEQNRFALFATNKLYHREASSLYYSRAHFIINGPTRSTRRGSIIPFLSNRYVRYLTTVTFSFRTGHPGLREVKACARVIDALSRTDASFKELTLRIRSAEGIVPLMNPRCDDSIMDDGHPIIDALEGLLRAQVASKVRILLDGTWLGPDVVNYLKDIDAQSTKLKNHTTIGFFKKTRDLASFIEVADLIKCERTPRGSYWNEPLDFTAASDSSNEDSDDSNSIFDGAIATPASITSLCTLAEVGIDSELDDIHLEKEIVRTSSSAAIPSQDTIMGDKGGNFGAQELFSDEDMEFDIEEDLRNIGNYTDTWTRRGKSLKFVDEEMLTSDDDMEEMDFDIEEDLIKIDETMKAYDMLINFAPGIF